MVGIMRLLPSDKITDLFALIPGQSSNLILININIISIDLAGTDGTMLMRNLVPRELLLPPSPIEETPVERTATIFRN